jgi:short-chain fatty acids transporter
LQRLSGFFVALMQRYLPDPWLFAIVLTFVVFLMGIGLTDSSALEMVGFWGEGLFGLLEFSMQMVLILLTGYVLARTRVVKAALEAIARRAGGPASAIVITTIFATVASFIQWGFGLIIGALLATEMARQVRDLDYRLVIASAYSGFLVWHAGFSGSVPLVIATPGHFLEDAMGIIPVGETIFAPFNLIIAGALLVTLPFVNRAMLPPPEERVVVDPEVLEDSDREEDRSRPSTPAEWLEKTPWLSGLVGVAGVIYLIMWFAGGGGLNLNIVILIFLIAGIILHVTPRSYLDSFRESVGASAGIILQFPFYAGVIGMMGESGLIEVIAS